MMNSVPVMVVSGNWVKKHKFVFNPDDRGSRFAQLHATTKLGDLKNLVLDDYGLNELSHRVKLSYMLPNMATKTRSPGTPPVYLSNNRQLSTFLSLVSLNSLHLCAELTDLCKINRTEGSIGKVKRQIVPESTSDGSRGKMKRQSSPDSTLDSIFHGVCLDYSEDQSENDDEAADKSNVADGEADDEEEDDEFSSRFDVFDDSDGESSDDENFTVLGKPPEENENSPNLTPKKSPHKNETSGSKGNFTVFGKPPEKDENSPILTPKKNETSGSKENSTAITTGVKGNSEDLSLGMCSLKIDVGQRYSSKDAFELAVRLLAVRKRFDFRVQKSTKNVVVVKCWLKDCLWKVRASTMEVGEPEFYVRLYDSEHTCSVTERSNRSRQSTYKILGDIYRDYLGDVGPSVKPKSVGILITKIFGIKMDYWKSYRTLRHARLLDQGTPERSFQELPSYLYMIKWANPGTFAKLQIDECARFKYVFLSFGASVAGFKFMRKVIVVDSTFLHGSYKGTLLTALAQDGNFQIFPIAFGVVDTENDESWRWFFTQLKYVIPDDPDLAIISDRHKSIGKAIAEVYPSASRGICTYYLYKNILVKFKGKLLFRLVKEAARCFRPYDFDAAFNEIAVVHPELHGYLQRADVKLCARVHFPGNRYNLMTSNIAESMNNALSGARGLPIVRLLEAIRLMMTRWFAERREDANSQPTTLSRGVEKLLAGRVSGARLLEVQRIDHSRAHVSQPGDLNTLHVVDVPEKSCSCRRFNLEKIPCVHAIAAAEKMGVSRIGLCSPYYRTGYLVRTYADTIMPPDTAISVSQAIINQLCLPPIVVNPPGRPKKIRVKSSLEVATGNKRPRKANACSRCQQAGHNSTTCPA